MYVREMWPKGRKSSCERHTICQTSQSDFARGRRRAPRGRAWWESPRLGTSPGNQRTSTCCHSNGLTFPFPTQIDN
eukprot:5846470-Pyramimonas_sp.AAC.1